MIKSMGLTFFVAFIGFAFSAEAQFAGGPPGYAMPGPYSVPGAAVMPGSSGWGSGMYPMVQPCAYGGGKVANAIDDDEGVIDAKDEADNVKEAVKDAQVAQHDAHVKLHETEIALGKDLNGEEPDTFRATAKACQDVFENGLKTVPSDCPGTNGTTDFTAVLDSKVRDAAFTCAIKGSPQLITSAAKAQCAHATSSVRAGGSSIDNGDLCVQDPGLNKAFNASGVNVAQGKYESCHQDAQKYLDAYKDSKAKDAAYDDAKQKIGEATKRVANAKKEAQKLQKEEAALDKETGDADFAGCPECAALKLQQAAATSGGINKTALISGFGVLGAITGLQTWQNMNIANQDARLGFPIGAPPVASAVGAGMSAGYPLIYAGLYGSTYGGMAKGGFGCSPTVAGGYAAGGPWGANGMYGGMGYPQGGGMYMPGYGPSGYAGPWGVNPMMGGMGGGYNPMMMGGMGGGYPMMGGMGGGYPMMAGGFGGGFNPMMGGMGGGYNPMMMGGMGGGYPMMAGGFGGGFNPMMGGMGGYNPMLAGGFGGGGYNPYMAGFNPYSANSFGSPYATAGLGSLGGLGAGGLNGGLYQQQLLAQTQSMMNYQRQIQLYATTMGQSAQLQQQALQYLPSGMSSGAAFGGLGGLGYGYGAPAFGGAFSFGSTLGGGIAPSGVLLPQTLPYGGSSR